MPIVRSQDGRFFDIPDEELTKREVKPDDLPPEQRGPTAPAQGPKGPMRGRPPGGGGGAPMQIVINLAPQGGGGGGADAGPPPGAGAPAEGAETKDVGARYCSWANWANWANWRNCGWRNCGG